MEGRGGGGKVEVEGEGAEVEWLARRSRWRERGGGGGGEVEGEVKEIKSVHWIAVGCRSCIMTSYACSSI